MGGNHHDGSAADQTVEDVRRLLVGSADPERARGLQRYFPGGVEALGVSNADVAALADGYVKAHALSPLQRLELAESLLQQAHYHEDVMLGFAVARKAVKRNFDADLLDRFQRWLEQYVSNWAQCDDLCLKVIYPFLLGHPDLITSFGHWLDSPSVWSRRAGNVALVKFVHRKIGREVYELPLDVILGNARRLLDDPEPYVHKSVGWLLKVATQVHPDAVVAFLEDNVAAIKRETLRIALEKVDPEVRRRVMALGA